METADDGGERGAVPPIIPAATLIVFRRDPAGGAPQLLMVERSTALIFAGGAAVFPGGRIDPADHALAARLAAPGAEEEVLLDLAARVAAVRETIEETGLVIGVDGAVTAEAALAARALLLERGALAPVLEAFGWRFAPERLTYFARWRPAHGLPRVFDTRFFVGDMGTGAVELCADATENTHLFWASAAEALRLADAGRIKIIFPTRRNLERLAQFGDFAAARAQAATIPVRLIAPAMVERRGEPWLVIPDDAGYPVTSERIDTATRS